MQLHAEAEASVLCFIVLSQYFTAPRTTKEMGLLHTVKTSVITSVGVVPERQVYWGAKRMLKLSTYAQALWQLTSIYDEAAHVHHFSSAILKL